MTPSRVPATPSGKRYTKPVCSSCKTDEHVQRNDKDEWFCLKCADEWLREYRDARVSGKSIGGVALPVGVKDERRVASSFKDVYPNRAARRRAMRRH